MKKLSIICFILLMSTTFVFGYLDILSIEERVKENNLIFIGKLINVSETETDIHRISKGTLVIEKVIYGDFTSLSGQRLKLGDKVQVEWQNSKMFACQFDFSENEKEIWFLTVDNEGNIQSLSPSTAASLGELKEVKKHLKKQKRPDNNSKKIKLQNEVSEIIQPNLFSQPAENTVKCMYTIQPKQTKYSPFSALLVILTSISLYYVLYRSRFKIR